MPFNIGNKLSFLNEVVLTIQFYDDKVGNICGGSMRCGKFGNIGSGGGEEDEASEKKKEQRVWDVCQESLDTM